MLLNYTIYIWYPFIEKILYLICVIEVEYEHINIYYTGDHSKIRVQHIYICIDDIQEMILGASYINISTGSERVYGTS